jgi:hypothetical protein
VAYDRKVNQAALVQRANDQSPTNKKPHVRPVTFERLFLIGQDFVFDIRPPNNPRRISPKKNSGIKFNAISPYPKGGALIVGPKGSIASIP